MTSLDVQTRDSAPRPASRGALTAVMASHDSADAPAASLLATLCTAARDGAAWRDGDVAAAAAACAEAEGVGDARLQRLVLVALWHLVQGCRAELCDIT